MVDYRPASASHTLDHTCLHLENQGEASASIRT